MKIGYFAVVAAVALMAAAPASACNRANPSPMDLSCPMSVFTAPVTSVQWFAANPSARHGVLAQCANFAAVIRPSASTCANAAAADRGAYAMGR